MRRQIIPTMPAATSRIASAPRIRSGSGNESASPGFSSSSAFATPFGFGRPGLVVVAGGDDLLLGRGRRGRGRWRCDGRRSCRRGGGRRGAVVVVGAPRRGRRLLRFFSATRAPSRAGCPPSRSSRAGRRWAGGRPPAGSRGSGTSCRSWPSYQSFISAFQHGGAAWRRAGAAEREQQHGREDGGAREALQGSGHGGQDGWGAGRRSRRILTSLPVVVQRPVRGV